MHILLDLTFLEPFLQSWVYWVILLLWVAEEYYALRRGQPLDRHVDLLLKYFIVLTMLRVLYSFW